MSANDVWNFRTNKFKQRFKRQLLVALRSGLYNQGRDALCSLALGSHHDGEYKSYEFCCLGVVAEEAEIPWETDRSHVFGPRFEIESDNGFLPNNVMPRKVQDRLAKMNDRGDSFEKIAKYIDRYL